jgi:hypothetical protein
VSEPLGPCRKCDAETNAPCRTKSGKRCATHTGRASAFAVETSRDLDVRARPAAKKTKPGGAQLTGVGAVALEDARQVARNRAFAIVDPELDAATVLASLVADIDDVLDNAYDQEQWDEREIERERDDALREVERLKSPELQDAAARLDETRLALTEAIANVTRYRDEMIDVGRRLAELTGRIAVLNSGCKS